MQKYDKLVLKQANRRNVISCITKYGPINKAAIAQKVQLSIPAVMKIVDDFEQRGIVRNIGKGQSSGGKRPDMLSLVPDVRYAIGVDIGRSQLKIVLTDLVGRIIARRIQPTGSDTQPPESLIERICSITTQLIQDSGVDRRRILGIGVGMPGLIDAQEGNVIFSPDFGWEDVPLKALMKEKLPYDVTVENANLSMARGEYLYGAGEGANYLLCVNIGHGIGAGIIDDKSPYYGASGTCGEIGHMTMNREGPLCNCGNTGCLEALASGRAIAQQARDIIGRGIPTRILALAGGDLRQVTAKEVFDAAALSDEPALNIVKQATGYIGTALASCINLLDPDRIVLCGGLVKNGALFMDSVAAEVKKRRMRMAGRNVRICAGSLQDDATAIGATCQLIEPFFESGAQWLDALAR